MVYLNALCQGTKFRTVLCNALHECSMYKGGAKNE